MLNGHPSSIKFANCAMFEEMLYVKVCPRYWTVCQIFAQDSKVFPSSTHSKPFYVRIIPRYTLTDDCLAKNFIGSRLCINSRLLSETVCDIDLDGCYAKFEPGASDNMSNVLTVIP